MAKMLGNDARMRALEPRMSDELPPEASPAPGPAAPEGGGSPMEQIAPVLQALAAGLEPDKQALVSQALDLLGQAFGGAQPSPEGPPVESEMGGAPTAV